MRQSILSAEDAARLAESLWRTASDCPTPRGIVLPLFDDIALLGVSLILELRDMGVTLPIEVPHCGDLDPSLYEQLVQQDRHVRVYDVCVQAAATVDTSTGRPLFCSSLADCHVRFRSFDIKLLALVLSRFQQVMLLDADTLFFQNPMELWGTPKYMATGTLFFHDRMSYDRHYLAQRTVPGRERVAAIHQFLTSFDVSPFTTLASIARPPSALTRLAPFNFSFEPSEFLMKSHAWTLRAGHQMDSSLVLWHKPRQPRATAILASFIARDSRPTPPPPSYGDKELYFLACELAETAYAFSEHGVGTIGVERLHDLGDGSSVLCGDALHYFPEPTTPGLEPQPLYSNSDHITAWKENDNVYRTQARPAWLYPGSVTARGLDQTCPFNVTLVPLMQVELALLTRRQQLVKTAENWAIQSGDDPSTRDNHKRFWRKWFGR